MFNRIYHEFGFQTLRLNDCHLNNENDVINLNQQHFNNNNNNDTSLKFTDIMKKNDEKFIMVTQGHRPLFLDLKLSELTNFFSVPICARFDGRTLCGKNCECKTSVDIGTQLYDKGCLHNFHQIGNYVIGSIVEQHTDPLTKIAIKFDSSMKTIKTIYCPCRLYFCPHAFALLLFRMKLKNFYAIKLPSEMFNKNIPQTELIKFYGFYIEESRSLPMIKDYHSRCWNYEQSLKQKDLQTPLLYAFCHKNLLPIDFAIAEEQIRARKWISDLYMKRNSQSLISIGLSPLPNAGEIFALSEHNNKTLDSSSSSSTISNRNKSTNSSYNSKSSFNHKKY